MITLSDDDIRAALAPYRHVRAPRRLLAPAAPTSRRVRVAIFAAVAAMVVAVALVTTRVVGGGSPGMPTGTRPLDLTGAETVVFSDGATVDIDELVDSANHERLQALFAEHGAELVIIERPVAPAADGRVYSVMVPPGMADETEPRRIDLDSDGRVEVEVGQADPTAGVEGLTLHEVFPEIPDAVDREDPEATGRALEKLGFAVRWVLIEGPGDGHDVAEPPPGTVVISVLGPNGEWDSIDPTIDTLMVELASPATAAGLDH